MRATPVFSALEGASSVVSLLKSSESLRGRTSFLQRTNYRGSTVSLGGGLIAVAGCLNAASAASKVAGLEHGERVTKAAALATAAGGVAGAIDDMDQGRHDGDAPAKGLHGHLSALAQGRVTTGTLKIAIIGSGALAAGWLLSSTRPTRPRAAARVTDTAISAVAIASWANVHNLLDLRPGRALKAAALVSAPLALCPAPSAAASRTLAWGALGVAAASAAPDLHEETMLGDTGANALGALVGTAIAAHPSRLFRTAAAAAGTALVVASEKVSFSRVIASNPLLARLDRMGRRDVEAQRA